MRAVCWLTGQALVLTVAGCSASGGRPALPRPTTTRPASTALASHGGAVAFSACHARVNDNELEASFWLGYDHFDPPAGGARHTVSEAISAYQASSQTSGPRNAHVQFALANYSRGDPPTPPRRVWMAISYNVRDVPSTMGGAPATTDQVVVIDDETLRVPWIIDALPDRC